MFSQFRIWNVFWAYQSAAGQNRLCGVDHLALCTMPAGRIQLTSQTKCGYKSYHSPRGHVCPTSFGSFCCFYVLILFVASTACCTEAQPKRSHQSLMNNNNNNDVTKREILEKRFWLFVLRPTLFKYHLAFVVHISGHSLRSKCEQKGVTQTFRTERWDQLSPPNTGKKQNKKSYYCYLFWLAGKHKFLLFMKM